MNNAANWVRFGSRFQLPMCAIFMMQLVFFRVEPHGLAFLELFGVAGSLMFMWCLWTLYVKKARILGLITSGLFRYTRHPMYLGFLLMNLSHWLRVSIWTSPLFLLTEGAFVICMVVAAYCQERETLERFGQEAVDYYARTPRIPFTCW